MRPSLGDAWAGLVPPRKPPWPRAGGSELNDLYAVIFAIPSIVLIFGGVELGWGDWATWVGAGIAAYGAIYFGFHDVIVHQRIAHRYVAALDLYEADRPGAPAPPRGRDEAGDGQLRLSLGAAGGGAEGGARAARTGRCARRSSRQQPLIGGEHVRAEAGEGHFLDVRIRKTAARVSATAISVASSIG